MHRLRFALVGLVLLGCSGSEGSTPPGGSSGGTTSTGGSGGTGGSQSDGGPDASSGGTSGTAGSPTGGTGGTSGTGGSGGTASGCTPGEKKCVGSTAQHCNSSGTWDDQICSTACIGGDCTVCVPGGSDCQGNVPRSCDGTGNWIAGAACSGQAPVCLGGSCVSCSPSSTQCSGTTAQTCNSTGFWQTTQTCPYVCSGGSCIGSCVPTAKQCSGSNVVTCDSWGAWQFTQTCPMACNSGSCGSCVNGSTQCNGLDAQSCNASGQWVTTATCPYVCSSGSCTGVCTPGSTQCSGTTVQTCISSGQWTNVTCQYVCSSGACTGSCVPTSKQCVGNGTQTCGTDGTWGSTVPCATPYCAFGQCTSIQPSCNGLAANCGQSDSCCSSAVVPGGTFYRSYDGLTYTDNAYPATISSFRLDKYEVTLGRFRKFWFASANQTALKAAVKSCSSPPSQWTDSPGPYENVPMNCISWSEASAFCAWDGGRLPTEAEWNYAASGGSEQRVYPWSVPPGNATIDQSFAWYLMPSAGVAGIDSPKGDGRWGHSNLSGNVREWVLDLYSWPYPITPCVDCANLSVGSGRVARGGGFADQPGALLSSYRGDYGGHPATYRSGWLGVRCARPL